MELESNLMNAYRTAYRMACEDFKQKDFEEISLNTNSVYDRSSHTLHLKYLNTGYEVDCSSGGIKYKDSNDEVTTTVKVLIAHYLLKAGIKPLSGKMISFKEIPGGGAIYYQTFQKRAILPLVKTFSNNLNGLYLAAEKLGGTRETYGHASVTIKVFPLVPVTYVVWQGDDEIPASGTILFDDTVTSFLPGEDIVLAASFGVYELMKLSKG